MNLFTRTVFVLDGDVCDRHHKIVEDVETDVLMFYYE